MFHFTKFCDDSDVKFFRTHTTLTTRSGLTLLLTTAAACWDPTCLADDWCTRLSVLWGSGWRPGAREGQLIHKAECALGEWEEVRDKGRPADW